MNPMSVQAQQAVGAGSNARVGLFTNLERIASALERIATVAEAFAPAVVAVAPPPEEPRAPRQAKLRIRARS